MNGPAPEGTGRSCSRLQGCLERADGELGALHQHHHRHSHQNHRREERQGRHENRAHEGPDHEKNDEQRDAVVDPVYDRRLENRRAAELGSVVGLEVVVHEDRTTQGQRQNRRDRIDEVHHVDRSEQQAAGRSLCERPVLGALTERLLLVHGCLVEEAVGVWRH